MERRKLIMVGGGVVAAAAVGAAGSRLGSVYQPVVANQSC